jgi:hypothetical protein
MKFSKNFKTVFSLTAARTGMRDAFLLNHFRFRKQYSFQDSFEPMCMFPISGPALRLPANAFGATRRKRAARTRRGRACTNFAAACCVAVIRFSRPTTPITARCSGTPTIRTSCKPKSCKKGKRVGVAIKTKTLDAIHIWGLF